MVCQHESSLLIKKTKQNNKKIPKQQNTNNKQNFKLAAEINLIAAYECLRWFA